MKNLSLLILCVVALSQLVGCGDQEAENARVERDDRISRLEQSNLRHPTRMSKIVAEKGTITSPPSALGQHVPYEKANGKVKADPLLEKIDDNYKVSYENGFHIRAAKWVRTAAEGQPAEPELLNQPNRWVIFVGSNKRVSLEFYANPKREGTIFVPVNASTEIDPHGVKFYYDSESGIAIIDAFSSAAANGKSYYIGEELKEDGTLVNKEDAYFDVLVSDDPVRHQLPALPKNEDEQ